MIEIITVIGTFPPGDPRANRLSFTFGDGKTIGVECQSEADANKLVAAIYFWMHVKREKSDVQA